MCGSFSDATLTLAATQHATLTTHWLCLGMPSTIQSCDMGALAYAFLSHLTTHDARQPNACSQGSNQGLSLSPLSMSHYPTQFRYAFFFLSFFFSFTYLLIWCSHNLHDCTCLLCNCIHNVSSMLLNAYNLLGSVCIEKRGTLGGTCLDVICKCITSETMPIFIMWLSMMWSTEE